jgi:Mlc titration factor MtfA (ptsG expression regulator)
MLEIMIIVAIACVTGYIYYVMRSKSEQRNKIMALPLTDAQIGIINHAVSIYKYLPTGHQEKLGGLVQLFLHEKLFVGCKDLEVTEEMKLTIAAQACILLLGINHKFYPKLQTIYIYPTAFVSKTLTRNSNGVLVENETVRLGESWQNGPVVLAWDDVLRGAYDIRDGQNVVMHEFAHRLDQEDGEADGTPKLGHGNSYARWSQVLGEEFSILQQKKERRKRHVMNKYGATNEAEFFAVATETFFEKSKKLKRKHPELYETLKAYYHLDPESWGKR